jgi:hypothetical protein
MKRECTKVKRSGDRHTSTVTKVQSQETVDAKTKKETVDPGSSGWEPGK